MTKILFAGLGSIGARHIRDCAAVLRERGEPFQFDALRATSRPLPGDVAALLTETYTDVSALGEYDAAIISTPSAKHLESYTALRHKARAIYLEKPVFDRVLRADELEALQPGLVYVACPLRYSPVVRRAKEIARQNRVLSARTLCQSYLPDWRPGADYRAVYSAKKELGGGVRLDLIHEWDYLYWLFGEPDTVIGLSAKVSQLEITSDDCAAYTALYKDKILTLSLDYFARAARRTLELVCEHDTAICDIIGNRVSWLGSGQTEEFAPADIHREEMAAFLDLAAGTCAENSNPIETANTVLRLALAEA